MRKKILISTSTFPKGPLDIKTARFVYDLGASLREYYDVHVLAPHYPGGPSKEDLDGITVHRFKYFLPLSFESLSSGEGMFSDVASNPLSLFQAPFYFLSQLFYAVTVIKKERIDVLNAHWIVPQGLIGAVAKMFTGVTLVVTSHAADVFLLKRCGALGKAVARFIAQRTDLFLPVSSFIKAEISSLLGRDFNNAVIPMGVNKKIFNKKDENAATGDKLSLAENITFLFVGKLVEKKGVNILLKAAETLYKNGKKFNVVIAGGGKLENELKETASAYGISDMVKFTGWIKNDSLPAVYAASDCLVVPSIFDSKGETEGMPVVINEALSSGLPVVASRISGISDIVKPGVNGWLFRAGDFQGLSDIMERILKKPEELKAYSKNAIVSSRDLSYEKISERYRLSIEEAIKERDGESRLSGGKYYVLKLNFHDKINICLSSTKEFYINYFKDEYCGLFNGGNINAKYDILVHIGKTLPAYSKSDISVKGFFKGLYPYECVIKKLDGDDTEVYFNGFSILDTLKFQMACVFLQTEILEPLIYYKALKKDIIMIHASGVFDSRGGYIFSAASGVGKTTLAFHLANKGFGFLGDDLLFLSSDGSIYSYPKRVHFFTYLKGKNPFLVIPLNISRMARFRHGARIFLKYLTGKHFYLSTRVDIKDILPKARIGDKVGLTRMFFLEAEGKETAMTGDKETLYKDIISTCDTRASLYENIIKRSGYSWDNISAKEVDIMGAASKNAFFEHVTVKDITLDAGKILDIIRSKA